MTLGVDPAGDEVRLPVPSADGRHLAIVGETGMGKSTLLVTLGLRALERGAVVLLDPVGETGRRLIASLRPADRSRALWISPTDSPVAINVLDSLRAPAVGESAAERCLSDLVDALRRVRAGRYAESPFWGPRIEETLRAVLRAAAAIPGATVADAERLLSVPGHRLAAVPPVAREAVERLWERIRDRPEELDGSRRLLAELAGRPPLLRMLAARRPRFRIELLGAPGRLAVVSGEAAAVGESAARYLLAVYLALIWSHRIAEERPGKTFLLLDEAQWYAHESLSEMLRLGRRTNLHVWLATQALASLPEAVREAVRTNVADLVVFRGSPDEARELARLTPAITVETLWSLPKGVATVLIGKGERVSLVRVEPPRPARRAAEASALIEVARSSRPFWEEESTGAAETEPGPGPPPAAAGAVRRVLLVLWAGLLESPDAESVTVHLEPLRLALGGDPGAVRDAGRVLRSNGSLAESDRDARGSYWRVGREGFDRLLHGSVGSDELQGATSAWREATSADRSPLGPQYS